jgi:uncharacterized protein (TIGR02646 family)
MIRIKRPRKAPPALSKKGRDRKTERQRAIDFYNDPNRKTTAHFTAFTAYSDFSVKKELRRVFNKKCAYCEKPIPGRNSEDIEHYRPKGAITDVKTRKMLKPGYYWLAADWSNLLLSCKDCNSPSEQEIADIADGTTRTIGKHNYFPTSDNWYGNNHRARRKEKPLLADPCREDPEKLFSFDDIGYITVKPSRGFAKKKAEETIRILGLDSLDLTQARREHAVLVKADLTELRIATRELNEADTQANRERVGRCMQKMALHLGPTKPFLALTRSLVRAYFQEHGLPLAVLEPHLR